MKRHWVILNVIALLAFMEGNISVTLEDVTDWGETREARRLRK